MSENSIIARPYAKAIFQIAMAQKHLSKWSEALTFLAAIAQDAAAQQVITDPRISWQQKATLFVNLSKLNQIGQNLINILAANRRLLVLPEIARSYEELRALETGLINVRVIATAPLTKNQQQKLQAALKQRFQKDIAIQCEQDQAILGGLKIHIGDQVIDGSIRGALNKLRTGLWH